MLSTFYFVTLLILLNIVVTSCVPAVKEYWFEATIDHFNFRPTTPDTTFNLRYLVNEDHYDNDKGPVFFYAGNEADIFQFVNNSGFMFEASAEFSTYIDNIVTASLFCFRVVFSNNSFDAYG